MVVCVIPAYRAASSIADVVAGVMPFVDRVIVVDDCCPERTGDVCRRTFRGEDRIEVIRHAQNAGVGGAMKTGIARALALGATAVVKIDADGQMNPRFIPDMLRVLRANPKLALVKGNRFYDSSVARVMPALRLFGNSVLTLLARVATGFWGSIDPTNGFLVVRASTFHAVRLESLADRYFFEISLLGALGMRKREIGEMEMPAIYGAQRSSLSIRRAIAAFPPKLAATLAKRLLWQYVIADMNVGSVMLVLGATLTTIAVVFGGYCWALTIETGIARTPGTVMLAFLPLITGFQLLLNALLYDVQFAPAVLKIASEPYVAPGAVVVMPRAI
jgi:glycosyltransferase involved in cell wall biosynthesis